MLIIILLTLQTKGQLQVQVLEKLIYENIKIWPKVYNIYGIKNWFYNVNNGCNIFIVMLLYDRFSSVKETLEEALS